MGTQHSSFNLCRTRFKMPHAAPSRVPPTATSDLEAGAVLKLGEFQNEVTLNLSEARIILQKTLATRAARGGGFEETETTAKTRENLERFEKSQLGSLVPTCSDEAKALIPSLERKVEEGIVNEEELEGICRELQRLKRQAQL